MKLANLLALTLCAFVTLSLSFNCSSEQPFPFPTNPIEKNALPKSVLVLDITPNPTNPGSVTQTWILKEINGIGMRIDSILAVNYTPSGSQSAIRKLPESDIIILWEYTYIPKKFIASGTLQTTVTGERGGKIIYRLFGHDDNYNNVATADTVLISP